MFLWCLPKLAQLQLLEILQQRVLKQHANIVDFLATDEAKELFKDDEAEMTGFIGDVKKKNDILEPFIQSLAELGKKVHVPKKSVAGKPSSSAAASSKASKSSSSAGSGPWKLDESSARAKMSIDSKVIQRPLQHEMVNCIMRCHQEQELPIVWRRAQFEVVPKMCLGTAPSNDR